MAKRAFDLIFSLMLIPVLIVPLLIIAVVVKLTSKGPAVHWSKRIGKDNSLFLMPKFRTMYVETPQVATHLLTNSNQFITPVGTFLRKTSLDELPQLYSVLVGDMSFVGPRPALFNQDDLVKLRTEHNVHQLRPGITGWAQVNGRDELPIPVKVNFEIEYLKQQSFTHDLRIILITVLKVIRKEGIKH